MDVDERKAALKNIANVVPSVVFDCLINILTTVGQHTNDAIVTALNKASTNPTFSFTYIMNPEYNEGSITPIREILDLCEGWFITSTSSLDLNGRVHWHVKSLIEKELPK